MSEDEGHSSRENTVRDILKDFDVRRNKQEEDIRSSALKRQNKKSLVRSLMVALIFLFAGSMIYMAFSTIRQSGLFQEPNYWALGLSSHGDHKMNRCIGNLWKIRKAVDIYYTVHGDFPGSMDALYKDEQIDVKYLRPFLLCPESNKEYVFKDIDGKKVFCCPSPETHGVSDIFVEVRSGAPVVKKLNATLSQPQE